MNTFLTQNDAAGMVFEFVSGARRALVVGGDPIPKMEDALRIIAEWVVVTKAETKKVEDILQVDEEKRMLAVAETERAIAEAKEARRITEEARRDVVNIRREYMRHVTAAKRREEEAIISWSKIYGMQEEMEKRAYELAWQHAETPLRNLALSQGDALRERAKEARERDEKIAELRAQVSALSGGSYKPLLRSVK